MAARVICPVCRVHLPRLQVVVIQPTIEILLGIPATMPTGDVAHDTPCSKCRRRAARRIA